MGQFYTTLLYAHITGGFIALATGIAAMLTKKGGQAHIISGLIYFGAMTVTCAAGLLMSYLKFNPFLLFIAVFSYYFTWTGYRFTKLKKDVPTQWYDKMVVIIALLFCVAMLVWAAYTYVEYGVDFAIILTVFGLIWLGSLLKDCRKLNVFSAIMTRNETPNAWFFEHLNRMGGSYIATSTAFLVVNLPNWHPLLVWLSPTVIGVICMTLTSRYYKEKMGLK